MTALITFHILLIIVLNSNLVKCNNEDIVTILINNYEINGKRKTTIGGKQVNVFRGIPYAEPPVGELRFKKPVPMKRWPRNLDAFSQSNCCIQNEQLLKSIDPSFNCTLSEDCLYLNIWSPVDTLNSKALKPVMFFVHGGALMIGSANLATYQGSVIAAKGDVVFVSMNYRLGLFGFLYTGTDDAPGNVGLWDQAYALKWVNDNIQYFGGDPQQITLFGQSGGSWAIGLHILSPVTRNLFKNAIMNSGALLNKLIDESPQSSIEKWIKGAELIGCKNEKSNGKFMKSIIKCLKDKAPEEIDKIIHLPLLNPKPLKFITLVVFDGEFLPQKPQNMLSEGNFKKNFSLLFSTVEDEGSMFLMMYNMSKFHPTSSKNFTLAEATNELNEIASEILPNKAVNGEEVAKLYFDGLSDNEDFDLFKRTIGIAFGDYYFTCPTLEFAKQLFKNSQNSTNIYQYHYNKLIPGALNLVTWSKIHHGADIPPIFGIPLLLGNKILSDDKRFIELMVQLITDFARTGVPTTFNGSKWPRYYMIKNNIIAPYYEMTTKPKPDTQFGKGLKNTECEHLWKQYYT